MAIDIYIERVRINRKKKEVLLPQKYLMISKGRVPVSFIFFEHAFEYYIVAEILNWNWCEPIQSSVHISIGDTLFSPTFLSSNEITASFFPFHISMPKCISTYKDRSISL